MIKRHVLTAGALILALALALSGCVSSTADTTDTTDATAEDAAEDAVETTEDAVDTTDDAIDTNENDVDEPDSPQDSPTPDAGTLELPEEYAAWGDMIDVPAPLQGVVVGATDAQVEGTTLAKRVYLEGVTPDTWAQWQSGMGESGYEQSMADDDSYAMEYTTILEMSFGDTFNHTDQHMEWLGPDAQNVTQYFMGSDGSWTEAIYNTETGFMIITNAK